MNLNRAILEALAYSDIFEYPLQLEEIHRYLPIVATLDEVRAALPHLTNIDSKNGYYYLKGRDSLPDLRAQRTHASLSAYAWALRYGQILSLIPFVRMVALTGSLAVKNLSARADMDFMLVTQPGRLWIARLLAVTLGRIIRLFGHRICINLLISENALHWHRHDLYSAREMCQMIPIAGFDVYQHLRAANTWTDSFLPNAAHQVSDLPSTLVTATQPNALERWCMALQLRHINRRNATEETLFTADICQGNFDNHRSSTQEAFQSRVQAL